MAEKVIEAFARKGIRKFNEGTFREIVRPLLRKEKVPSSWNAIHMPAVRRLVQRNFEKKVGRAMRALAAQQPAAKERRFAVTPRMKLEALHLAAADHLNDP